MTVLISLLDNGYQLWTFSFHGVPELTPWPQLPAYATFNWLSACRLSLELGNRHQVEVTLLLTVSQSVSQYVCLSVEPTLDLRPDIASCFRLKVAVLFLWGAFYDEKMGLQFAVQSLNGLSRAETVTILYCLIWDSLNLEGQIPLFISPRKRVAQLYPPGTGFPLRRQSSKFLYDWRSVCQYVLVSSTLVGLATRYYFLLECCCLKFAVLFMCGALSDERMGLQLQCIIRWSEQRRTRNHTLLSHLRLPQTWRVRFPYLHPPGIGWPRTQLYVALERTTHKTPFITCLLLSRAPQ
jgi:hypothetical protein